MRLIGWLKGSPKVAGPIGYYGLAEWWLATLTEDERQYIESASNSPTGGGSLTEGEISYSSGSAARCLSGLATNFYKRQDRRIARLILSKAEELAKQARNVLDLHFVYAGMIKTLDWEHRIARDEKRLKSY